MAKTELTIVMPGGAFLFEQALSQHAIPSYLGKLLKRAKKTSGCQQLDQLLFNHFSATPLSGPDLPVAHLETDQSNALKLSPCYLHADRDRLLLFSEGLTLSDSEQQALHQEILPLLADWGQLTPQGHLLLHEPADVTFSALDNVEGRAVEKHLPQGEKRRKWLTLWNEIQMQLHASEFNQQRLATQQVPINSIWFWGAGEYRPQHQPWQSVQGQSTLLHCLVEASDSTGYYQDRITPDWSSARQLWLLETLDTEADWEQQLQQMDKDLFAACWRAISSLSLSHLTLQIPGYAEYHLSAKMRWQFWL